MTLLLVHGGLHGAWCWEPIRAELSELGVRTEALDLPGHGDDPTPRSSVTLDSYVQAVNGYILQHDLRDLVLVGHSIAGMSLPMIAAANEERIDEVVFLAALVLEKGERGIDLIPEDRRPRYFQQAEASADNTISVDFESAHARFFNHLNADTARRYFAKLNPQPLAPYLEPSPISADSIRARKRYILCTDDRTFSPEQCRPMAAKLGAVPEEIESDHDAMLSHPVELAALLLSSQAGRP